MEIAEAMMAGQPGFFDLSDRYEALSAAGDPLERFTSPLPLIPTRGAQRGAVFEPG